jgi:hypothetical protein
MINHLHLREKIDGNGQILMEKRSGEFHVATAGFEAETRRLISSSLSAPKCRIIRQNVDNEVVYRRATRDADMTSASYLIL